MNRSDLTRRLVARLRHDEAVVAGIGHTNHDLRAAGHRPQNFYMLGSMGLAVPIALGVALAQPARRVLALEGDGSILMQLGVLGTVAAARPRNLAIVLFDNQAYNITGGQPTHTARGMDLVAVAKGAGLAQSEWARDEAHFEALLDRALAGEGPSLIAARVDRAAAAGKGEFDATKIRAEFMKGLGTA